MASPPRLRLARLLTLGGAVAVTVGVAVASVVVPDRDASAATTTAVADTTLPTVSAPTGTPASAAPTTAAPSTAAPSAAAAADPAPPAGSGAGRRIVFDESDQRVWLIEADGTVDRTYLVSGSRFDNLDPGSYQVTSKQRTATSFDYTGTMEYFVRFATGWSAPIGFHSIPVDNDGKLEQSVKDLGRPLSAGCVRQLKSDAKYLWDWAPIGTPVVVTA